MAVLVSSSALRVLGMLAGELAGAAMTARCNKKQCHELAARCNRLTTALTTRPGWIRVEEDSATDAGTASFLSALRATLDDALELIKKFQNASWIKRFFRFSHHAEQLSIISDRLSHSIQDLQLLVILDKQLWDAAKEKDAADWIDIARELQSGQGTIIDELHTVQDQMSVLVAALGVGNNNINLSSSSLGLGGGRGAGAGAGASSNRLTPPPAYTSRPASSVGVTPPPVEYCPVYMSVSDSGRRTDFSAANCFLIWESQTYGVASVALPPITLPGRHATLTLEVLLGSGHGDTGMCQRNCETGAIRSMERDDTRQCTTAGDVVPAPASTTLPAPTAAAAGGGPRGGTRAGGGGGGGFGAGAVAAAAVPAYMGSRPARTNSMDVAEHLGVSRTDARTLLSNGIVESPTRTTAPSSAADVFGSGAVPQNHAAHAAPYSPRTFNSGDGGTLGNNARRSSSIASGGGGGGNAPDPSFPFSPTGECRVVTVRRRAGQGLGMMMTDMPRSGEGQLVQSVVPDSVAAVAGVLSGEELVGVNGVDCRGMPHTQVVAMLAQTVTHASVILTVRPPLDAAAGAAAGASAGARAGNVSPRTAKRRSTIDPDFDAAVIASLRSTSATDPAARALAPPPAAAAFGAHSAFGHAPESYDNMLLQAAVQASLNNGMGTGGYTPHPHSTPIPATTTATTAAATAAAATTAAAAAAVATAPRPVLVHVPDPSSIPLQLDGLWCCSRAKLATEFVATALSLSESQLDGTRDHCFRCKPAAVDAITDGEHGRFELPRAACAFGLTMPLETRVERIFTTGAFSYLAVSPRSLRASLDGGDAAGSAGGGYPAAAGLVTTPSARYSLFDPTHPGVDFKFADGVVRRVKLVVSCKLARGSFVPRAARLTTKANNRQVTEHIPWETMERVSADGYTSVVPVRLLLYILG